MVSAIQLIATFSRLQGDLILVCFLFAFVLSLALQKSRMKCAFDLNLFVSRCFPSAVYGYFQIISKFYTLIIST